MIDTRMEGRLRASGVLLIAGLSIEALSFLGKGPIGFLLFASLGLGLIVVGVGFFLYALVSMTGPKNPAAVNCDSKRIDPLNSGAGLAPAPVGASPKRMT